MATLGARFRKWFYIPAETKVHEVPPRDAPARRSAPEPQLVAGPAVSSYPIPNKAAFDRFASRLQDLAAANQALPYGQINIVGLDKIEKKLGPRWPDMKEKVHLAAGRIIGEHMSPLDVYVRYSDSEYLIVLAGLSPEAAQLKCAKLARDIAAHFLGSPETAAVTVKTAVGRIDDELVFKDVCISDLLQDLAQRAKPVDAAPPANTRTGPSSKPDNRIAVVVRPGANPGGAASAIRPAPVEEARPPFAADAAGRAAAHAQELEAGPPSQIRRMVSERTNLWAIADDLPSFEEAGRDNAAVSYRYRPVWDLHHKVLSTYFCVPVRAFAGYGRRFGYAVLEHPADPYQIACLDLETFKAGLSMLDELLRNRFQMFIVMTVQFATVTTPRYREVYLEIANRVPHRMRKFVVFELTGLPEGVPQCRLSEVVNSLKPFASAVLARISLRPRSLANFFETGLHAVGFHLRDEQISEAELIPRLHRLARQAERHRLSLYLNGVKTTSLVMAACGAGVRYVAGNRVGELTDVPTNIHRYKWEDFLNDGDCRPPELDDCG